MVCLNLDLKLLIISPERYGPFLDNVILRRYISLQEFSVVFNTVVTRSYKLIQSALASTSRAVAEVFRDGIYLVYTSTGHNYH